MREGIEDVRKDIEDVRESIDGIREGVVVRTAVMWVYVSSPFFVFSHYKLLV